MALTKGKASLLSIFVFLAVGCIGAVIMMWIEYSGSKEQRSSDKDQSNGLNITVQLKDFIQRKFSVSLNASNVELLLEEVKRHVKVNNKQRSNNWKNEISLKTFRTWHYYATTTMTTVGYGDVYPETIGGKLFAIVFAFIGIPVSTYMLATVGSFFCMVFSVVKYRLKRDLLKQQVEPRVTIYCVIQCTAFTLSFVVLSGIIIATDQGWHYFDGIYFSFITFTTIGYGDLTMTKASKWYSELLYSVGIIGLILMSMTFTAVSKLIEVKETDSCSNNSKRKILPHESPKTTTV